MLEVDISTLKDLLEVVLYPPQIATVCLWGKPGQGKSSAVSQIVKRLEKKVGKPYDYLEWRLALKESTDLTGLPFPEGGCTKYLPPKELPKDPESHGILFLDELNRAREDVINAAFQLVLDRRINEFFMPKGWSIVIAGNLGDEDKTLVRDFDAAFYNRMLHFKVKVDQNEWIRYMRNRGNMEVINKPKREIPITLTKVEDTSIVDFLTNTPKFWNMEPRLDTYANPRTWEFLQKIIERLGGIPNPATPELLDTVFQFATATVGPEAASAFRSWLGERAVLKPEEVLKDLEKYVDQIKKLKRDQIYQLIDAIGDIVISKQKLEANEKKNLIRLLTEFVGRDQGVAMAKKIAKENAKLSDELCYDRAFVKLVAGFLDK
jgi:hypothetical protein